MGQGVEWLPVLLGLDVGTQGNGMVWGMATTTTLNVTVLFISQRVTSLLKSGDLNKIVRLAEWASLSQPWLWSLRTEDPGPAVSLNS